MSRSGHTRSPALESSAAILVKTFGMRPGDRYDPHTHEDHQLAWAPAGC